MTIAFDTHTHTIMSGHAFSTLEENVAACVRYGMDGFVVADHGPAMPNAPHDFYFMNLRILPRVIDGIHLLRGVELNIVDCEGNVDLPDEIIKNLDVCIASFHEPCIDPQSVHDHTAAWLNIVKNPYIDIIGHSGRGPFPYNIEKVITACRDHDKLIEINSFTLKTASYVSECRQIAEVCKRLGVKIVVSSDAHFSRNIGQVQSVMDLLAEIQFPQELIANQSYKLFSTYLKNRKPWLKDL